MAPLDEPNPPPPPPPRSLRAEITAVIDALKLRNDPMALMFELLWMIISRTERLFDRMEKIAAAPRTSMTDDEIKRLARVVSKLQPPRPYSRQVLMLAGAVVFLGMVSAGVGGFWLAGGFLATCSMSKNAIVCHQN